MSTSADAISGGGSKISPFDSIYIKNIAVMTLIIEKIEDEKRIEKVNQIDEQDEEPRSDVADAGEEESELEKEAWVLLRKAVVSYCGRPVGTLAADDPATESSPLNYDHVFIRDFVPSALAFLLKGEKEIVKNFMLHTLQLQSWEKNVDCYSPGQQLMMASFKVRSAPLDGGNESYEVLDPDFGESAIRRLVPVDSGL